MTLGKQKTIILNDSSKAFFTLCNYRFQITSQKSSPNSDNNSGYICVCVCVCVQKPTYLYLYQKVAEGVSSNLPWNWICFKIM